MVAIMFWMAALPITTEFMMQAIPELMAGKSRKDKQGNNESLYFDDDE
jgi:hypothetical protein